MKITSKCLITALFIVSTLPATAYADWETATNIDSQDTGNFRYTTCVYKTDFSDLMFQIVIKSTFCPMWIEYDPERGIWRKR